MRVVSNILDVNFETKLICIKPNKAEYVTWTYYCLLVNYDNNNRYPFKITSYSNNDNFITNKIKSESYHCIEEIVAILAVMGDYTILVFDNFDELSNYKNNYNLTKKLVR